MGLPPTFLSSLQKYTRKLSERIKPGGKIFYFLTTPGRSKLDYQKGKAVKESLKPKNSQEKRRSQMQKLRICEFRYLNSQMRVSKFPLYSKLEILKLRVGTHQARQQAVRKWKPNEDMILTVIKFFRDRWEDGMGYSPLTLELEPL